MENASTIRSLIAARAPRTRSAVTNGRRLHVEARGDTAWARRFRDVLAEIVSDLGGPDRLSEGQRQLARRCALLSVECEKIEGGAVEGKEIDLDTYGQLTDRMGRAFQRLGLRRVPRNVAPELDAYITSPAPQSETVPTSSSDKSEVLDENLAQEAEPEGAI